MNLKSRESREQEFSELQLSSAIGILCSHDETLEELFRLNKLFQEIELNSRNVYCITEIKEYCGFEVKIQDLCHEYILMVQREIGMRISDLLIQREDLP